MAHSKHWLGLCALVLLAAGFVALGRWQLERAASNRASADSFAHAAELPQLERPVLAREAEVLRYRRIRLRGVFAAEVQILLDNMTYRGQAGYQVLTPLKLAEGGSVLVNRGWLPASPDRSELPDVSLPHAALLDEALPQETLRDGALPDSALRDGAASARAVEIAGRIGQLPRAALELGDAPAADERSLAVLSFPDYTDIEAVLAAEVHPFVVLLDPDAPYGFVRDWAPATERADRNIAYAVQWFGLAALAFGLALGFGLRRRQRRERHREAAS